jgi:hypothetical protein
MNGGHNDPHAHEKLQRPARINQHVGDKYKYDKADLLACKIEPTHFAVHLRVKKMRKR